MISSRSDDIAYSWASIPLVPERGLLVTIHNVLVHTSTFM